MRLLCMGIIFVMLAFSLQGCVTGPHRIAKTAAADKDRGVAVVDKMRREAVSRAVGRWAVVIGISDYKYDTRRDPAKGIPDLRYANRDAKAFAKFLMSPEGGAFASDHVLLLTDRKATIKEVRKAIGDFLAQSLEDDLVVIFYAGHGIPDPRNPKNLYLLCHDTEPGNYYGTALPMWELDTALTRTVRSKRVFVFADACHSAAIGGTRGKSTSTRFNRYLEKLAVSKEGVTKITASRSDELSQEKAFSEGGHGVFTYYLLKGLRGEADENGDGFVTMKEGYDYLYDRVRSETRHSQNPWASSYVSADIPIGIVDPQVLDAIRARVDVSKKKASTPARPYWSSAPSVQIPKDSALAIKLARAKLAKDEQGIAREMTEAVLKRNDAGKPDALALKIDILLREGDLQGAEDVEDRLVILYPDNPAARKGARLVYRHYLKQMEEDSPAEQIRELESYLKRHSEGPLKKQAKDKIRNIRSGVKARYKRRFDERLVMAEGLIRQNRFERARAELDSAAETEREANSTFGIALDTKRVADLRLSAEQKEAQYRDGMFRKHLESAKRRFIAKDYTGAYGQLDKARNYATSAQTAQVETLARRYNAPPEVKIVLESDTVDWEMPVRFKYEATDKEGDPVRVVAWQFGDGASSRDEKPEHAYAKWSGSKKEKKYTVTLKATDGSSTVKVKKTILVKKQDRIIKTFKVNDVTFRMIRIPAGEFLMGSSGSEPGRAKDEGPLHRVSISSFWMGETEVTQGLWRAVMGNNPSHFGDCGDNCPVENVSWNDCREFIMKLNQVIPGRGFRLPTEAEWEYACRAGTKTALYTGQIRILGKNNVPALDEIGWYGGNSCVDYSGGYDCSDWSEKQHSCSRCGTHPAGMKKPNAWGLYDMIGNVWEWCEDWYGDYPGGHVTDPKGASSGTDRVLRGGSWYLIAWSIRSAHRLRFNPDIRYFNLGFRLVRAN